MIQHTVKWAVAEGDPNQWAVGITKATFDRIIKEAGRHRADALALYVFYAVTARWQHTNIPRATNRYVAHGLGWGEGKVISVRKILLGLGLIETVAMRGERGRIRKEGWLVKVNYVVGRVDHDTGLIFNVERDQTSNLPGLADSRPKEELLVARKEELLVTKKLKVPLALEDAIAYGRQIGLAREDVDAWWDYHAASDWMQTASRRIVNGKASLQTWKRNKAKYAQRKPAMPYKTRQDKINSLNQRKAALLRMEQTTRVKVELEQIRIQLMDL